MRTRDWPPIKEPLEQHQRLAPDADTEGDAAADGNRTSHGLRRDDRLDLQLDGPNIAAITTRWKGLAFEIHSPVISILVQDGVARGARINHRAGGPGEHGSNRVV